MRMYLLALALPAIGVVAGCSRGTTSADTDPQQASVEPAVDPSVVRFNRPEGFPLVDVQARPVPNELLANCVAQPDVEKTVHVTSLAPGRVIDIRARLGDDVQQGQVLLVIHSADLAAAIAEYRKAQADEALSKSSLERAQSLFSHGALAQKDLQQAQDVDQKARVDVETAAGRIRILGGDLGKLSPLVEVKAPVSGTIIEQNTTGGEGVKSLDNSPSLFTIADLSRVWVMCDVYENDLGHVRAGDYAQVALNAYPGRPLRGRVGNIARVLDPNTRAAKVRIEMDNRQGLLRPGMFASARFTSQGTHLHLVVPPSAILRLHDKDWVFRSEGQGRFRRTEVTTGPSTAGGQEILAGNLHPGDQVVANALQFSSATEQM